MYLVIIILPLLGSIVSGFFGRKVGVSGAQFITCFSVIVTTILAVIAFFEVGFNNIPVSIELFRWIDSEWFNILWGFEFDSLTVSMLIPVLIISSLVHIYSISYMSNDPHVQRFFSYLSLFTFMMIILVTANNYLLMFVGWEGVGVCSYLLVSFWFTRIAANQSSISAFLTNRVGDCFLTIGMFAILWSLGNLDYATVFSLAPYINENVITIIGICLLIGAMAKSSQVGLHVWLPMAMEGPTPVSALIHSEETLSYFREYRKVSEETRKNLSEAATGRILPPELRKELSEIRKGIKLTDETRSKIAQAAVKLRGVTVSIKDTETSLVSNYSSLTEAAEALGVSRTAIRKSMDQGRPLKGKYVITSQFQ